MKKSMKTLTATAFTLSAMAAAAQNNVNELLEQLQLHEETPMMELNVGQLIQIINFTPVATPICANFSGEPFGSTYFSGQMTTINGIDISNNYTGGGRIVYWDNYGSQHFMEMVEDGYVTIDFPATANEVSLKVIQGGNQPIYIEYFNQGSMVTSRTTSIKDVVEQIDLTETAVDSVTLHHHELLLAEICYQ